MIARFVYGCNLWAGFGALLLCIGSRNFSLRSITRLHVHLSEMGENMTSFGFCSLMSPTIRQVGHPQIAGSNIVSQWQI